VTPAEKAVLAALLESNGGCLHEISLEPRDFSTVQGEILYGLIQEVVGSGRPADPLTVEDEASRLDEAGRRAVPLGFVWTLTDVFVPEAAVTHHAAIVAREAARRRFVAVTTNLNQRAQQGADVQALAEEGIEALTQATTGLGSTTRPVAETIDATLDSLDSPVTYVESPWQNVNHFIQGWRPGALYVIGARPSVGKTVCGFQAALSLCNRGPVAFTSLEMGHEELELRMVSQEAKVDMGRITRRQLTNADWERVGAARERWEHLPLFIDPSRDASMAQVARHAWSVKRKHGLAAVVVDYLGLIEHPDSRKSEYEVVTETTRKLKLLAQALGVPIIALSQLSRKNEGREQKTPQLADLRSSGAIEQDADVVILMHRDLMESPHEADLIVAKNRHGITGTAEMDFIGHNSCLRDKNQPSGFYATPN
jgi:replicative DNA helicase